MSHYEGPGCRRMYDHGQEDLFHDEEEYCLEASSDEDDKKMHAKTNVKGDDCDDYEDGDYEDGGMYHGSNYHVPQACEPAPQACPPPRVRGGCPPGGSMGSHSSMPAPCGDELRGSGTAAAAPAAAAEDPAGQAASDGMVRHAVKVAFRITASPNELAANPEKAIWEVTGNPEAFFSRSADVSAAGALGPMKMKASKLKCSEITRVDLVSAYMSPNSPVGLAFEVPMVPSGTRTQDGKEHLVMLAPGMTKGESCLYEGTTKALDRSYLILASLADADLKASPGSSETGVIAVHEDNPVFKTIRSSAVENAKMRAILDNTSPVVMGADDGGRKLYNIKEKDFNAVLAKMKEMTKNIKFADMTKFSIKARREDGEAFTSPKNLNVSTASDPQTVEAALDRRISAFVELRVSYVAPEV